MKILTFVLVLSSPTPSFVAPPSPFPIPSVAEFLFQFLAVSSSQLQYVPEKVFLNIFSSIKN